jgi:hypothetical protein
VLPTSLKAFLKNHGPYTDYRSEQLRREAVERLGGEIPLESEYRPLHRPTLGIFFDGGYTFAFNVAACRDLKVGYKVIDLLASDWLPRVVGSGCAAFLATPPTLADIQHRVFEERLWCLSKDVGALLCPTFEELYLWESKRRMHDWLVAHDVPHPATWVFVHRDEAMEFCRGAEYPMVAKTDAGAASSGVFVLRDRRSAERLVVQSFGRGIPRLTGDMRGREKGALLFQEFVPHDFEWRVVRIGRHFLCRRKTRVGDYASGSGAIEWAEPPKGMLDFARLVTDAGGFRHITLDVFKEPSRTGRPEFLVNELQAIVGLKDVLTNAHTGVWRRDTSTAEWLFESGAYHQNACANLRVKMLLGELQSSRRASRCSSLPHHSHSSPH